MINGNDFRKLCADQSVTPHPTVLDTLGRGRSGYNYCYEHTGVLAGIVSAGSLHNRNPALPLLDRPLEFTPELETDFSADVLAHVLNATVAAAPRHDLYRFDGPSLRSRMSTCSYAEASFSAAIIGLKKPDIAVEEYCSQIITDQDGDPLFLRKEDGVQTSLALQAFALSNVVFPAGSIVGLTLSGEEVTSEGRINPSLPTAGVQSVPARHIQALRFLRLSAFALPAEDRKVFASTRSGSGTTAAMRRVITSHTTDTIAFAAKKAVS